MAKRHQSSPILLEADQFEILTQLARQQGKTISEIAREIVRLGLESYQINQQQHVEAWKHIERRREEISRLHGVYPGDAIATVRAERAQQIDRIIGGEL